MAIQLFPIVPKNRVHESILVMLMNHGMDVEGNEGFIVSCPDDQEFKAHMFTASLLPVDQDDPYVNALPYSGDDVWVSPNIWMEYRDNIPEFKRLIAAFWKASQEYLDSDDTIVAPDTKMIITKIVTIYKELYPDTNIEEMLPILLRFSGSLIHDGSITVSDITAIVMITFTGSNATFMYQNASKTIN